MGLAVALALVGGTAAPAAAQTTSVTAVWDANADGLTRGYVVYYGTSPGSYPSSYDAGGQTSAQLTVNRGSRYYFVVRAYDASATLGPPSNEATIDLTVAPTATISATLQSATSALVTWSTTNAVSATLNGTAVAASGSMTMPISGTTTFTLVATGASGATATRSATVTVTQPAPTATLTASLQNATTALVTWSTTNATTVTLNGAAVATSGSQSVPVSATTTFTLVATGAGGTVTRTATVTVTQPAPTATLTASLQNATTALVTWSTTNASAVTINGAGVATSGSQSVPVSATTTFTLVATGAGGTVTRTATVTVTQPAPTATITAAMQDAVNALVTWSTSNATTVTLNGAAVALSGSRSVPVSATTTFTLVATGAGGTVTRSATVTVTTATSAPQSPTTMLASVDASRVTLTWNAPTSGPAPTHYLIDVGTTWGGTEVARGFNLGNVLRVAADLPRGRYYARVRAANGTGMSGYSNIASFRIGRNLVSPTGFVVQWQGTQAVLTWTQPVVDGATAEDQPTGYVLEAGTARGQSDVGRINVGSSTRFTTPVPPGRYFVRVRAVNDVGESDPTPDLEVVTPGLPAAAGAPRQLTASGSALTLTLRWQAPANGGPVTGYQLEAGSAPGLADIAVAQVGNVTSFSTPVPPGTYYIRVKALNGGGAGLASNEVVVRR